MTDHADALDWLRMQPAGKATAIIYDPPYAVGTWGPDAVEKLIAPYNWYLR